MVRVAGHLKEQIIASLSDADSRRIVVAASERPRTATEIESSLLIPQSTLYRKITELKDCGLLMVDHYIIKADGRREAVYACPFRALHFMIVDGDIDLDFVQSEEAKERKWYSLFFTNHYEE